MIRDLGASNERGRERDCVYTMPSWSIGGVVEPLAHVHVHAMTH